MGTLNLVRHAKAGDRGEWQGDDRVRPLSRAGWRQAEGLVDVFQKLPVDRMVSSPYLRCVQTLEPLARQRGLRIEPSEALAEGAGARSVFELMRTFPGQNLALCTHGDVIQEALERLAADGIIRRRDITQMAKGSTWVIDHAGGKAISGRYLDAP